MMVASAVVLAGVMIGVMPMGVVRRRLRMGSIGHGWGSTWRRSRRGKSHHRRQS